MVRLHTETQHPMLPGNALKVCVAPPPLIWWRRRLLSVESEFSDRLLLSFSLTLAKLNNTTSCLVYHYKFLWVVVMALKLVGNCVQSLT